MKKKTKRVDSRSVMEGQNHARWTRFCQSGAPWSLGMLVLFAILSGMILAFDRQIFVAQEAVHQFLSVLLLMFVLSAALGLYVFTYEPVVVKDYRRGIVLLVLLLLMLGGIRLIAIQEWSSYFIVAPVTAMAVMMTIAYSQRFALGVGAILVLMAVVALRDNLVGAHEGVAVILTTGSGMGIMVLGLNEIRSRTKLIKVSLFAGLGVFAMVWFLGYWQRLGWGIVLHSSLVAVVSAVAVGFLMEGLLSWIEKLFVTATNMTLLDYTEANKPLLRRLAVEAPGTFNHSWQIGMMAEAAADAIGANGLLCRVGSYYHDIGKLNKPRFFVENQGEAFNQHEGLSATMSKMIIIGHVKDGLELAHEYKLPKILHQFIASHHGTTLVEFFYHQASKEQEQKGQTLEESDFRYPGPKPRNRETGIVMLCDAIEGATRALSEPTPTRIENVVNALLMKRLLDGQFNECDLTMRELRRIETSLVKTLCGMYHGRIAYPTTEKKRQEDKSMKRNGEPREETTAKALPAK